MNTCNFSEVSSYKCHHIDMYNYEMFMFAQMKNLCGISDVLELAPTAMRDFQKFCKLVVK